MALWIKTTRLTEYAETLSMMEDIVSEIISNATSDTIILTEHKEVITAGTSALNDDLLYQSSTPLISTGRGGKHTFHGPGQRVIYPIIDLKNSPWNKDLKKYLNFLHDWLIAALKHFNIIAHKRDDYIGVWVEKKGVDAKIAAIGIRARKWVVFHGMAINITTDLNKFESFIPCGINSLGITSIADMGIKLKMEEFDEILKKEYYNNLELLMRPQ